MRAALIALVGLLALAAAATVSREDVDSLEKRVRGLEAEVKVLTIRVKHLERGEAPPETNGRAAKPAARPTAAASAPTLSAGAVFTLPAGVDVYPLYADDAARKEFGRLAFAKDVEGMALMTLQGRCAMLLPGVRVRVIEVHGILDQRVEVRVLDGPCAGESGLIDRHLFASPAD